MNTELTALISKTHISQFAVEKNDEYTSNISYEGYLSSYIQIELSAIEDIEFIKAVHNQFNKDMHPPNNVNVEDLKRLILSADCWFSDDATRRLCCRYETNEICDIKFVFKKSEEYNAAIQYLKEQDNIEIWHSAMNYQNWWRKV